MAQKNPFLKYLIKDKKEDVFHSSGYAKAQSGGGIGAASSESYRMRVNLNQNRQVVRGYKDSEIMTGTRNIDLKAKTYEKPVDTGAFGGATKVAASSYVNSSVSGRPLMMPKNPGISIKK